MLKMIKSDKNLNRKERAALRDYLHARAIMVNQYHNAVWVLRTEKYEYLSTIEKAIDLAGYAMKYI